MVGAHTISLRDTGHKLHKLPNNFQPPERTFIRVQNLINCFKNRSCQRYYINLSLPCHLFIYKEFHSVSQLAVKISQFKCSHSLSLLVFPRRFSGTKKDSIHWEITCDAQWQCLLFKYIIYRIYCQHNSNAFHGTEHEYTAIKFVILHFKRNYHEERDYIYVKFC